MPNRFTRVPERGVPELPAAARALLPVADLFMVLMVSRPPSGTLRDTWVTPATLWLSLATGLLLLAGAGLLLATSSLAGTLVAVLLALLALGCLSVVAVALAQRRAARRG